MNDKFDELTRGLARSVTRRGALRQFGAGLAGVLLACIGIGGTRSASAKGIASCCTYECETIDGTTFYRARVCYATGGCLNYGRCRLVNSHLVADCSKCKN